MNYQELFLSEASEVQNIEKKFQDVKILHL